MSEMTVEEYKARMMNAEREDAKKGMKAHVIVTVAVSCILATVNLVLTPQVLWFVFPVTGMTLGTVLHYALMTKFMEKELIRKANQI